MEGGGGGGAGWGGGPCMLTLLYIHRYRFLKKESHRVPLVSTIVVLGLGVLEHQMSKQMEREMGTSTHIIEGVGLQTWVLVGNGNSSGEAHDNEMATVVSRGF